MTIDLKILLLFSAMVHLFIIFKPVPIDIKLVTPLTEQGKPSKTLIVSIIRTPKSGTMKGFPSAPGEQAETFLPDDSCAWSIEQQKEDLEYDDY